MAIGANIKRIRKLKKVGVADLAEKTGIKPESIYAWERGDYNPNEENLQSIAKFLGVPVKEFYEENHTHEEKLLGVDTESFKTIVAGGTEYVLIPRVVLRDTQLISAEQLSAALSQMATDKRLMEIIVNENMMLTEKLLGIEAKPPATQKGK